MKRDDDDAVVCWGAGALGLSAGRRGYRRGHFILLARERDDLERGEGVEGDDKNAAAPRPPPENIFGFNYF
jgi:hypothetical protein